MDNILHAELLTDEERAQFAEKDRKAWFYRTLDKLWLVALGDDELTKAFCDKAASMKGKPSPRSNGALRWLLMQYAMTVEMFDGNRARILDSLIAWNRRTYGGAVIDRSTMDNRISDAITKIKLDDLPEWTHQALQKRRARYRRKNLRKK